MKKICIAISFFLLSIPLMGQSIQSHNLHEIDSATIKNWTTLGLNPKVSEDGNFFMYIINNKPSGNNTLIVQATGNNWRKEWVGINDTRQAIFTHGSKKIVVLSNDTLYFQELGENSIQFITGVSSIREPETGNNEWLIYQLKQAPSQISLLNLVSGFELKYSNVASFTFDKFGKVLLITKLEDSKSVLQWVDLKSKKSNTFYESDKTTISSTYFDVTSDQLVIIGHPKEAPKHVYELYYYRRGTPMAVPIFKNNFINTDSNLYLEPFAEFSNDGKYIIFSLRKLDLRKQKASFSKVNIWSYKDPYIQSAQIKSSNRINNNNSYKFAISIEKSDGHPNIIRLTYDNEILLKFPFAGASDMMVIQKDSLRVGDRFWLGDSSLQYFLISLKNGRRIKLPPVGENAVISFSPNGNYLLFRIKEKNDNIYSYEIKTGNTINLSSSIPGDKLIMKNEFIYDTSSDDKYPKHLVGIAGWTEDNESVLLYDNYDIWLLSLTGKKAPLNLTNEFGVNNSIKFRIIYKEGKIISRKDTLLLTAFNTITKHNGFYKTALSSIHKDPVKLTMGPYTYFYAASQLPANPNNFYYSYLPLKAQLTNTWIVLRHNLQEAPNLYLTNNFETFHQLTSINPHKFYNWPSAELIRFKQMDGMISQGVLYKPRDFDSSKKYPLLICYYEQLSHRLYQYPTPNFSINASINIPWFVSRGYLVFTPDIYFKRNQPGPSALRAIQGAAKSLSGLSYVNEKKIGISGHSYAGGLTNYIVTHSHDFAAAFVGAGVSDQISASLQLSDAGPASSGFSRLNVHELTYFNYSIWQKPFMYIDQSPVLNANKVTTPLLMFYCRDDNAMPWEQGVEMFISLRRNGKKAWMLEYDEGGHSVKGKDAEDLTKRITQFFDYYLKEKPAPSWMTDGIPYRLKGIDDGFNLDKNNAIP